MYLYLLKHSAGDGYTVVGLAPSSRGRAPKNHHAHEFTTKSGVEFSGYFAGVSKDTIDAASSCAEMKQAVVDGAGTPIAPDPEQMTIAWAAGMHSVFKAIIPTAPPTMQRQMESVVAALDKIFDPSRSGDTVTEEERNEIEEIIANNKKLCNVALGTLGASWTSKNGLTFDAVERVAKKRGATSKDEGSSPAPANEPKASAFGFERLSGEKPELKIVDPAAEPQTTEASGVFMPKPDSTYIINENTENLFKILNVSRRHGPQNVNLVGPHGCGKTELAIQFSAAAESPMLIMDCANLREARDWFGYKTAREGTVYWHESQFVRAVEAGGHVILLDELNRANPHILNTLMPLLDGRRFTYLEEKGDKICVGPGTVFFATMNEGAGYTGTTTIDRALRDRFPRRLELTYLSEKDEIKLLVNRIGIEKDIATLLVQMANKIRQDSSGLSASLTESVSTRQLLAAAYDFVIGGVETLQFTISNHFSPDGDDDSERVKVQNIIQGKFGHLLAAKADKKKGA
jgi:MoxR-like ATPase